MPIIRNIISVTRILAVAFTCKFICTSQTRGEYLTRALEKLGPSFIKLGQALSVRPDVVGEDIARKLERLQDKMPPFPYIKAIGTIAKELGANVDTIFIEFSVEPVAAASIAQVHKAITKDGKVVAVKILRPDIERKFKRDIALFYFIARILSYIPAARRLRLVDVVGVFAATVRKELDLRIEAACASQLRINRLGDQGFYVPLVLWEYTARRVLVTEWVDGIQINDRDALVRAGHDLKTISKRLAISFLNQAFVDGFFHADIHPGNLFVDSAGNIVPVDFGIMGRLDQNTRIYVAEILRGFLTGDYMHVARIHFEAGYVAADKSVDDFAIACRAIGEPLAGLPANQISIAKLLALLFKITEDFDMHTQPQLLLLQKTMMLIEGVGSQLYPEVNMWKMAEEWIGEWTKQNFGLEHRMKAGLADLFATLRNIPQRLKEIDVMLAMAAKNQA